MSPTSIAWTAAIVASVLTALLPTDIARERHLRSWLPQRAAIEKLVVATIQTVGTLLVGAAANTIDWVPADDASGISALGQGVAWAAGAVAALRAEFSGFKVGEGTPGFSLLRSASKALGQSADAELLDTVRAALPDDPDKLWQVKMAVLARAYPNRTEDGSKNLNKNLADAACVEMFTSADYEAAREYLAKVAVEHRVGRW
jgi:hypothetical protein